MSYRNENIRRYVAWCCGLAFFVAVAVDAAEFRNTLVKGQGVEVCEAYVQALNHNAPQGYAACLAERPLDHAGIRRPEVRVRLLEFHSAADLSQPPSTLESGVPLYFTHILPFSERYDVNPIRYVSNDEISKWVKSPAQLQASRSARDVEIARIMVTNKLPVAAIDIDNDGRPEQIFFYRRGVDELHSDITETSVVTHSFGAPMILMPDSQSVDRNRTLRLLRAPFRASRQVKSRIEAGRMYPVADMLSDSFFGFFEFAGTTYIDFSWQITHGRAVAPIASEAGITRVYMAKRGRTQAICAVRCVEVH